ncbi:MAG TPA: zinc ABC transporter substrate-binding protein [Acidimicrobiia bacterium]|jgi:zinc/manganese transport system substrate-binding protein|nr:zinc ABC transporter substrate-binding protein [Acidimicrobiia bacterium]
MRTAAALLAVALLTGCATSPSALERSGGRIQVVAAENFWGSLARQVAGDRADVSTIIEDPATDPHDYEATPSDARAIATAQYVILNGVGYDSWARKLLDADPESGRVVLDVGRAVDVNVGGNPHQWYSPSVVDRVIERIAADLARLDPRDADYFARRRADLETTGLAEYHSLIAQIRRADADVPVGASESIVVPLFHALGVRLETPSAFLDAVAEGNEPTARDTAVVTRQIDEHAIEVFVFNRQNATPDVQRLVDAAEHNGIPIVTVTETLTPKGATFQTWQVAQLRALRDALARVHAREGSGS